MIQTIIPNLETVILHSPISPNLQTAMLPFSHAHRPEDTLYVEVTIPVIRPVLRLVSNGGSHTLNFETVATGTYVHTRVQSLI